MNTLAPVVVICFRRPEHLRNTLQSLQRCAEFDASPTIVCCDGPRTPDERPLVEATRAVARELLGTRAEYRFLEQNVGLAESVIRGARDAVERHGKVIVVEDDLTVAPNFLSYMNRALDRYENDAQVFQISGYQFPVPEFDERDAAMFLPITVSWGWGTWKRAWGQLDVATPGWRRLLEDRKLRRSFNLDGTYDYSTMLLGRKQGRNNSWAILWYWTAFSRNGIVLFPPRSLVQNHGMDGSGTHGRGRLRSFRSSVKTADDEGQYIMPAPGIRLEDYELVKTTLWRVNGRLLGAAADWLKWQAALLRGIPE